jgi:hypothetical protein
MRSIGETNGQIIPFRKRILARVEITSTRRATTEATNGTVNGYRTKREMIKAEVRTNEILLNIPLSPCGDGCSLIERHAYVVGKPVHTVQLMLAERMYKLRDVPQNIEFYGPPHPEDPQGSFR